MRRRRPSLLWIDAIAGLTVGAFVLLLSPWLSRLYALPLPLVVVMGFANAAYGCFSFSLARRAVRPRALVVTLVVANGTWAALCALTALFVAGSASWIGLATLWFECAFVGGLAALEWRQREALIAGA